MAEAERGQPAYASRKLRVHSAIRSAFRQPAWKNASEHPLELGRAVKNLKILLPLGSIEAPYDVRIVTLQVEKLAASSGAAKSNEHISSPTRAGLRSVASG